MGRSPEYLGVHKNKNARFSISKVVQNISIFFYIPEHLTLHFSTMSNEGTHVSVSTAFVFRYSVSLNAFPVLVETHRFLFPLGSHLRRRKVPWNKIFYTSTFVRTWTVQQWLHDLVLSALLKDIKKKVSTTQVGWYPEIRSCLCVSILWSL